MNLNRYKIEDGRYVFHIFTKGQKFNSSIWLENDGRFIKREDGSYYDFYNIDGTPDLTEQAKHDTAIVEARAKQARDTELNELKITHNTVAYDANGKAIGNMSAVMGIANFKYNQAVANGEAPATVYQRIYKDTQIFWKGADNEPHEVMIESICEALEKSMLKVSNILGL